MIYLDHNATTPIDERVVEAMRPYQTQFFGNPSSLHKLGRLSRGAIDQAREQVAALVGAKPFQVIFTSGGTEANNLAIKGLAASFPSVRLAFGATEHPSVSEAVAAARRFGATCSALAVNEDGQIRSEALEEWASGQGGLVSVMLANNETGVVQDLAPVVERARRSQAAVHTDAVQAAGKIAVDFESLGVQLMSLSGHKIGGPKGVGALITDQTVHLEPLLHGGGQEQGLRGGTENVAAIVGFGKAAELARAELTDRASHVAGLRSLLEDRLSRIPGITLFARSQRRLPNTLQIAAEGVDGEMLVMLLDRAGIAVSSGSACASGGGEPSPVLTAMGVPASLAKSAVRISLGSSNSEAHVDALVTALKQILQPQSSVA
jgi:cysteine desulfurase